MIYTVTGGNAKQRKVVDTVMSFVVQFINVGDVFIDIELDKFDSHGVIQVAKRCFLIEIVKTVSIDEIAYAICHEMKHVEQLCSKRLQYTNGKSLWLGEDHSSTEYFERPWEIEAYKFEKIADTMLTRIAA